jgi:hypothetical protein
MYATPAYLYQQIQRVLLIDTSGEGAVFQRRWDPVYAKKLTINKGVDNVILFEFVNQDQKPVNITGSTFWFRIINLAGDEVLYETELVTLSATTGRAKATILSADSTELPTQPASYSIERFSGNLYEPVFVNAQAQGRADVDIVDSVYPAFEQSQTLTIPNIYGPVNYPQNVQPSQAPDWALPPNAGNINVNVQRYSSQVPTLGASLTTFQLEMDHFTGNIKAEAAEDYEAPWYNSGNVSSYYDQSGTVYINVEGYHPLIRLAVDQYNGNYAATAATANAIVINGSVDSVEVTYAGSGYLAAPKVSISGTGAGAEAVAILGPGGSVAEINVINGGSGYVIPPSGNLAARVQINTGFITDIIYR